MSFLDIENRLEQLKRSQLIRERLVIDSPQASELIVDGEQFINFASNDYLGLAANHAAADALNEATQRYGFGSGASHLIVGHQLPHEALEQSFANFVERDAALSFSSGYMANIGILQSLAQKGDMILADKLNHASLIDGVRLSSANSLRYLHCDIEALEKRLSRSSQNTFVVTDSVFSMDGDIAPLDKIAALCEKYNAVLIVDDAHGFGVLGEKGRGAAEYFSLNQKQLPVLMSTLGKALGGYGAMVSGEKNIISYLTQTARSYIYTTAMPAPIAAANLQNLQKLQSDDSLLKNLHKNIENFKNQCKQNEISSSASETPIQPLIIGDNEKLLAIKTALQLRGILVGAIRPPTVPKNSARLRITITAAHSNEQIERLVSGLKTSLAEVS